MLREQLAEAALPVGLLQHHAMKSTQRLSITHQFYREIQLINITGLTSTSDGSFRLVVQNSRSTETLTLSSTTSQISNALRTASLEISSTIRECSYFSVSVTKRASSVEIYVTFESDATEHMTRLQFTDVSLKGLSHPTFFQRKI